MIATTQEIAALEQFFNSITIPDRIIINKAITFTDLPRFVHENIDKLKNGVMSDIVGKPRYDDLLQIKATLEAAV